VWLVRKDQQLYAMKRVPYDPEKHKIPLEIEVLKQLDSPYIVKYHDSFIEKSWLCIVMEYCEGGDLQKLIQAQREHGFFTEQQILTWFTQMCLALQHMHSKKILHRDLKPQNIFLASPSHLKIGDFGISRCLDNSSQMANTSLGTPYYLSPEVCLGQPYDAKSDMWMLGCCLYELVTLQRPFTGSNLNQIVLNILNKAPDELGGLFGRLISMLLQKNAFARSDTSEILQVPEIAATVKLLNAQTTPQKFKSLKSTKAESNLKNSSILTLIQKAKETNMSPKKPLAQQPQKAITVFLPEQIISEESKTIAPI
jgi:NIMA (never in mitosis gene a)-related kinase